MTATKAGERDGVDDRAIAAAANNADLYEAIFRAHGLSYRRDAVMFSSAEDPPAYYGNITTLSVSDADLQASEARRLRGIRGSVGVKDGFCRLDLTADGFEILFVASWIWAPAQRLGPALPPGWERIGTVGGLAAWEDAWKRGGSPTDRHVFPARLLSDEKIDFFGRKRGDAFDAGCILNRSEASVGLSNIFGIGPDAAPHSAAVQVAARMGHGRPVVGYDRDDGLRSLTTCGFERVGELRVWVT